MWYFDLISNLAEVGYTPTGGNHMRTYALIKIAAASIITLWLWCGQVEKKGTTDEEHK